MITLKKAGNAIVEPEREIPLEREYDVIVAGGGMAGAGAGIAAARRGMKTLIVERESSLGGLATVGLVNIPLDFVCGIGMDMFTELKKADALWHRNTDPEKHKLVLDRMVLASGCDILFHTQVVESLTDGDAIRGVVVESKSGRQAVLGKCVIDCSGDADAAYYAGAECMIGRKGDGVSQGVSLEFRLGGVDWDRYMNSDLKSNDPKWIQLIKKFPEIGKIDNHLNWLTHVPGRPEHCGKDEVSICFAHSRNTKPLETRDLTRMYLEGREQVDVLWKFIRDNVPGYETSWLIDTAPLLGVRESRRVLGEYVVTARDIASHAHFDDVITISAHGYDLHGPDGPGNIKWSEMEVDGETRYVVCNAGGYSSSYFPEGGKDALSDYWGRKGDDIRFDGPVYYDIPFRALLPVKTDNLIAAGRCLSADFMAQSGCRLVMACMNMGQAAGTAAALAIAEGIQPRRLDRIQLQQELLADNMNIGQSFRRIPGVAEEQDTAFAAATKTSDHG